MLVSVKNYKMVRVLNTIKAIAKNTIFIFIGQIINILLTYFYTIYTARYLGAAGFGILSFAIAFTGISGLLADLGLSLLTTREVSRNNLLAGRYVGNILIIKSILSVITLGFTAIAINLLGYSFKTCLIVYLITFSTIFNSFTGLFNSVFQAFQKMEYMSLGIILNSLLIFTGTAFVIYQNLGIFSFAFVYLFASTVTFVYSLCTIIWRFLIPKLELDLPLWKNLLKESIPFCMTGVFIAIYFRMDIIILSMMKGEEIVGWYAASYRVIDGLSVIPSAFMSIIFPVFSKYYIDSKKSLELAFEKSLAFITIIAIPIGVGTMILSNEIILFIYGNMYLPSASALRILIWASVLGFINLTPATLLISINKQRTLMIFTFIGAILNLVLNYLLIPSFSYEGAAVATVITELVIGLLMLYEIQKIQNLLNSFLAIVFRSLISAIFMGIFVFTFKNYTLFLLLPSASIIYFISLFVVNGIRKDDLNMLNQAWKDRNG